MDRLTAMQAFAKVAEMHSFSQAARHLRLSKSLISRQVSNLEAVLGIRLFQRTTRSLTLTEAGHGYYKDVIKILAHIEEANLSVSQHQASPRGKLRINAPMSFGVLHLAPAIPDFLALYPEIDMDIALNDRMIDLVEDSYDLGIRIGHLTDSSLVARKLSSTRKIICASPAYLKVHGTPMTPDDLIQHRCLCYSNLTEANEWRFLTAKSKPWPVEVKGRLRANNGDLLRDAALKGLGLVNLPSFIVGRDLQAGSLVSVLGDYMPQDAGVFAVYPHSRYLSPKVRVFVDFLAQRFGTHAPWDLIQ